MLALKTMHRGNPWAEWERTRSCAGCAAAKLATTAALLDGPARGVRLAAGRSQLWAVPPRQDALPEPGPCRSHG